MRGTSNGWVGLWGIGIKRYTPFFDFRVAAQFWARIHAAALQDTWARGSREVVLQQHVRLVRWGQGTQPNVCQGIFDIALGAMGVATQRKQGNGTTQQQTRGRGRWQPRSVVCTAKAARDARTSLFPPLPCLPTYVCGRGLFGRLASHVGILCVGSSQ